MLRQVISVVGEFGGDFAKNLLWVAFLVLAGSIVVLSNKSIRDRIRGAGGEEPISTLGGAAANLFRALVGLGLIGLLCLHLVAQSREFERLHGRVSETNYSAVLLTWGRPHAQTELQVRHTYETVEVTSETFDATGENVVSKKKAKVVKEWPQNSIQAEDVNVDITMNYRRKGSAYYTCYESKNAFKYEVVNFADIVTDAGFTFPLPDQGLIDNLKVTVDGEVWEKQLAFEGGKIKWSMKMQPQQKVVAAVSYDSRGMESYYYQMPVHREIRNFSMVMNLIGVKKGELNYPGGCMTPTEDPKEMDMGEGKSGTRLVWKLDRALTTRGMGVALPSKKPPGYYVARLLKESPLGLVLLMVMLLVTRFYTERPVELVPLAMVALAYYLFYTLLSNMADYAPGFVGSFIVAFLVLNGLVAAMQFRWDGRCFTAYASVGFFAFFALVYPLMQIPQEHTGLMLNILYVLLLGYAVALAVRARTLRAA